ncbi:MAG TPA: SH3 domain-containing protein [Anaerolineales bacterium]
MQTWIKIGLWILLVLGFASLIWLAPAWTPTAAQQPTGNIPTVTGTASGPIITVTSPDGANVRAGPSAVDYDLIGWLVPGGTAPALGRSPAHEWIEITYLGVPGGVGWVYAPLVSLSPGFLPILEPPPTATPRTTPTINPTFAAAFQVQTTPTRLPTFTPPPPLATLNFEPVAGTGSGVPMGFVILGLALVGILGAVISFLRGR